MTTRITLKVHVPALAAAALAFALTAAPAAADVKLVADGLYFHLDAADPAGNGSTPGNGATFSTWANLASTGNALDAVLQTHVNANAPTWRATSGPTGGAAVEFDALSSSVGTPLKSGTAADWKFLHDGSPFTIFIVSRTTSANPNAFQPFLDSGSAATGANVGMSLSFDDRAFLSYNDTMSVTIASGVSPFFVERIDRATNTIANDAYPSAQWDLANVNFENGRAGIDMVLAIGGHQAGASDLNVAPSASANAAGGLFIGSTFQFSFHYNGLVSELLIYDRALTFNETRQVGTYLEEKYALEIANLPEPASALLLMMGGIGLLKRSRRRFGR